MNNLPVGLMNVFTLNKDTNYNTLFNLYTDVESLELIIKPLLENKVFQSINDQSSLINGYLKNHKIITTDVLDLFYEKFPKVMEEENVYLKLFDLENIDPQYIKKRIPEEDIRHLQQQGLIHYYYKETTYFNDNSLLNMCEIYPEIFFTTKGEPLFSMDLKSENISVYKEHLPVFHKIAKCFKKDKSQVVDKFKQNILNNLKITAPGILFQLGLITLKDIPDPILDKAHGAGFNYDNIVNENLLSKRIINKVFDFHSEDQIDILNYIKKIPNDLINECDLRGYNIMHLLTQNNKIYESIPEAIDLMLNTKNYNIINVDDKGESIFLKDIFKIASYVQNKEISAMFYIAITHIYNNADKYLPHKGIVSQIGNDLLHYLGVTNKKSSVFDNVFALKEKEHIQHIFDEKKQPKTKASRRL